MALECNEHHHLSAMTTLSDFDSAAHLTPVQLVERWKDTPFPVSLVTLARWRRAGKGPAFIRAGHSGNRVYYPMTEVLNHEHIVLQHHA